MNYVLEQAVSQAEAGAQVLDVNVGAPGVDEPVLMEQVVKALQDVYKRQLQSSCWPEWAGGYSLWQPPGQT